MSDVVMYISASPDELPRQMERVAGESGPPRFPDLAMFFFNLFGLIHVFDHFLETINRAFLD